MPFETLIYDVTDNIARITLNRPKAYNALSPEVAKELAEVALLCEEDDRVRCVVLTGSGDKAFCAGGDVAGFVENYDQVSSHIRRMIADLHVAVSRFAWLKAPVIVGVNGVAAGAGLSLVAFCDLAIAASHATFTSAYTGIGVTPDGSSTYFLPRLIGVRRALELAMTNRVLSAEEALDWGLVNKVVAPDALAGEVDALATALANGPTMALAGIKKLYMMAPNETLESQMERETRTILAMTKTAGAKEGMLAFTEKRKPVFTGR